MLTGELRSQINAIWDSFWSGGISNPLEVMEQITYLLFIRRLDDAHSLEESKASILKRPMQNRIFPEGADPKGRPYNDLRWSRFKHFAPSDMHTVVGEHVFPFLRTGLLTGGGGRISEQEHAKNNLPDVLARWARRNDADEGGERQRPRTAQSFCVPKADIAAQGYDLSINRYKEVVNTWAKLPKVL